jgi:hypothetical protein
MYIKEQVFYFYLFIIYILIFLPGLKMLLCRMVIKEIYFYIKQKDCFILGKTYTIVQLN